MPTLTAKFSLEIGSPCRLSWPDGQIPEVIATFGDCRVAAKLVSGESWRGKYKDDTNWTTLLCKLAIDVTKDECESCPGVIVRPDGMQDYIAQSGYLRSKQPEYQKAAYEMAHRILLYFQYSLFTPFVETIALENQSLQNPTWYDETGTELKSGSVFVRPPIQGLNDELGAKKLSPVELPKLQLFVLAPREPSLAEALLSEAQTAWFEGSLRRSVLELAICTEVLVKRCFFAHASPAGAAFDYLEDKGKVSVRVLDLLDSVAEEAFNRSFKKDAPDDFQRLDHLFRCRNKIAHRGELLYRDDSSKFVVADAPLVKVWWQAVANLKAWLESL